jgi:cytochrome c oxidase cbb3-type subunit 4
VDLNDFRMIMTVATFFTFVAIVAWAYSGRRRKDYERAARMALDDDGPAHQNGSGT